MHRTPLLRTLRSTSRLLAGALALGAVAALGAACAQPVVSVEVLPPRTSLGCDAPTVDDPALGTGLMDAKATADVHGGYVADLRVDVDGVDARVDGVNVTLKRGGKEIAKLDDVPTGDVDLVGSKDDTRRAVVENVVLVPRKTAVDLAKDTSITSLDFDTVVVEITPRVIDPDLAAASSTFALNVCNGCLVQQPPASECAVVAKNPVCRAGQDVPSFTCAQAATGGSP